VLPGSIGKPCFRLAPLKHPPPYPCCCRAADAQWRNEYPHPASLLPALSGQESAEDWYDLWPAGGPAGDPGYTFDCQRMRMHGGSGYRVREG